MGDSRRPLIAGNWKMNCGIADGAALAEAIAAAAGEHQCELLVCPPAPLLGAVAAKTAGRLALGGQDCHAADAGAHTGDTSAAMLKDVGCDFVIVGHSERRADHGETDETVAAKAEAAWRHGLTAIICIGETEAERDAGKTVAVVAAQIAGSVPDGATAENTVIAYEPVWAIGSGRTPSVDDVAEVHGSIRQNLAEKAGEAAAEGIRILYGGSMKPENAEGFLALDDVDGGLIGGASLKAEDFLAIAASCP